MALPTYIYIITGLALIAICGLVILNRRDAVSYNFLGLTGSIFAWIITLLLIYTFTEEPQVLLAGRLNFAVAALIPTFMYSFIRLFPKKTDISDKKINFALVTSSVTVCFISAFTPGIVESEIIDGENRIPVYGSLFLLFIIHFVFWMLLSFNLIYQKFNTARLSEGAEKDQLILLFRGLSVSAGLGLVLSLMLPALLDFLGLGNSELYFTIQNFAPLATLPFSLTIAYAIVRHKFLDIRVLIGRITYFGTLASITFIIFNLIILLFVNIFNGNFFSIQALTIGFIFSILFVFFFNSFTEYIRYNVTTRLINPGYNPAESVEKLSNEISLLLELDNIIKALIKTTMRTLRPAFIEVIIFGNASKNISKLTFSNEGHQPLKESELQDTATLLWQALGPHPIVYDDLMLEIEQYGIYKNIPNTALKAEQDMKKLSVKVVLPIYTQEKISGMILIGKKESDYPYTRQDVDFTQSLSNTTSVAIERSLLYTEVQQFANTLQGRVEEATKELLSANNRLQKALTQVQEARRRERDMMDVMGHELRTPISIVRNALAMLQRESKKDPEGKVSQDIFRKYVDMGLESARREIRLIETLLSATKVDASRLQLFFTKVDFRDVIEDGIEGQKMHLAKKPIDIEYQTPPNEINVYCDRTRVQEIVDNFLSNAAKYTMKGKVTISTWQDEEFGWIAVKDTGIGVSEQDLQKLGKKFFRARQYIGSDDDTKVVRPGGTGLGLYVTFELIRVMGGQLYINSEVGKGTTFTFSMPNYTGQPDKQFDQTFDEDTNKDRKHITINGAAPTPPLQQ